MSIVLLGLAATSCVEKENACLIRVGDVCIGRQALKERLERFAEESMITSEDQLDELKPMFVNTIVGEELVLQYARSRHFTVSDEEVAIAMKGLLDGIEKDDLDRLLTEECRNLKDMTEFVRKRALIKRTIERVVHKDILVTAEQVRQYYDDHVDEFVLEPAVELYHVFVRDQQQARDALSKLRAGMTLDSVVRQYSETEGERGSGFMGVFSRGELPGDVESVVFTIPERRYSNIIKTQRGYHIFYVAKRTDGGTLSLIEASDQIREKLVEESFEKKYAVWIEELRKEYGVEVDWNGVHEVPIRD